MRRPSASPGRHRVMAWLPNVANLWHCGSIQLSQLKSLPHVVLHRKQTGEDGKEERAQDPPFWPTEEKELDSGGDCAFIFFSFCFVFFQPSCLNLKKTGSLKTVHDNNPFPADGRNRQFDLRGLKSGQHLPLQRLQVFPWAGSECLLQPSVQDTRCC